jgi:hypothetical protein
MFIRILDDGQSPTVQDPVESTCNTLVGIEEDIMLVNVTLLYDACFICVVCGYAYFWNKIGRFKIDQNSLQKIEIVYDSTSMVHSS